MLAGAPACRVPFSKSCSIAELLPTLVSRRAGERQLAAVKSIIERHGRTVSQLTGSLQPLAVDWNRVGHDALNAASKVESALVRLGDVLNTLKHKDLMLLMENQVEAVKLLKAKKGKSQARQKLGFAHNNNLVPGAAGGVEKCFFRKRAPT